MVTVCLGKSVDQELSRTDTGILSDAVSLAKFFGRDASFAGNGEDGFAGFNLVIAFGTAVSHVGVARSAVVLGGVVARNISEIVAVFHLGTSQTVGLSRLLAESGATEHIGICCHVLRTEVEQESRIECDATQACLEVEVRTRAASGVSTQTDGVAGTYILVFFHQMA